MLFSGPRRPKLTRVLVIEDDPLIAFDNERTLTREGYDIVATVDSGEAALARLHGGDIDVLVLDIGLAGQMSGRDVAKAAFGRGIAVLLVTGNPPDDAADYAHGCLKKPHGAAALVAAIRALEALLCKGKRKRAVAGFTLYGAAAA